MALDYLLRFLPLDPSVDGSKIGRVYAGASERLQTVTIISIPHQMSTGRAIDVELITGKMLRLFGPRREKTCLRGFRQSEFQTNLLSYSGKVES